MKQSAAFAKNNPEKSNRKLENTIGRLLISGVILAAAVVSIGAVYYLISNGNHKADYTAFTAEPKDISTLTGIIKSVLELQSRGIIMLGLILLILTPIARVIFSLLAFAIQRDYIYTAISAIVLLILLFSLFNV
ncbi:MAG: DUF1634 domain-containing protein [Syntrophothermus sp.]